jgi:hypothetical protein
MKLRIHCTTLPLFCAVLMLTTAHALHCQSFQAPTNDELTMTTDPKAPGADAVYLYREEVADDLKHFHSLYVRIKILNEKGKELATVHAPYYYGWSKIDDIKGRTIHADGTIIPLSVKADDLLLMKESERQFNQVVFNLPDVEVGSIIEYRYVLRFLADAESTPLVTPKWDIQQPYFVREAHYRFIPNPQTGGADILNSRGDVLRDLMATVHLGGNESKFHRDSSNRFFVDLTDIPATPQEDWMPPLQSYFWHVYFYYTYTPTQQLFWHGEGSDWRRSVMHFISPTADVKDAERKLSFGTGRGAQELFIPGGDLVKAANELVSPSDSEDDKARKIYAEIMKFDNTDLSRSMSEAERITKKLKPVKNVNEVWKQRSGSSNELALLYVALANAVGVKTWPMYISDRNREIFDATYLDTNQLDDYIAISSIGGKEVYLDPGARYCAFGELDWRHSFAGGIRIAPDFKESAIAGTPNNNYKTAVTARSADITLSPDGHIDGYARYILSGPASLHWRQLALTHGDIEIKKRFNEMLTKSLPTGVKGEFDHFVGLDDPDSTLITTVKLSGLLGTQTGKRMLLPEGFFVSRERSSFVSQSDRQAPVDLHYAEAIKDTVTYHLPAGFSIETKPTGASLQWPNRGAYQLSISSAQPADITVNRLLARSFILLPASEYKELHDFYSKAAAADQQQIVLTSDSASPKGN